MKEHHQKIPKIGNVISKTAHLETLLDFVMNIVILDALEGFMQIKMGASWCKISHSIVNILAHTRIHLSLFLINNLH